ncbi:MAG: OmpA family protein [Acetobacteraceae bacterium]
MANSTLLGSAGMAAVASMAILSCGAAQAQPFQGFYVGAGAGYNLPQDIPMQTPFPTNPRTRLETEGNLVGLASVGYGLGNGWRLELEGNYRKTGITGVVSTANAPASGSFQTYGVMANALFDMDVGLPWLYPYVGGGAGYAWTNADNVTVGAPINTRTTGTQGGLAVQAIAGLSFPMPGVPGLSLSTEYRFFGVMADETFTITNTATGAPVGGTQLHQYNHSFLLGVRYAFNVAPPPMPAPAAAPAPAVQPARSYLVFFDWDKATLTDRARQIIKEAAENSTKVAYTRIEANGYTDTSGTPAYNQGLSVRRAQAVAAELVRNGVPREAITATGYGDTKLLVPTGPNVREAQNRRVEIVIR